MAGEVIELISSSPPPQPQLKARSNVTSPSTATRPTPHAAVDLDGLTDEFDTTWDVDEAGLSSQQKTNSRGSALKEAAIQGVEIRSDDFQSTGDLAEPILVESTGNGNKRRRLSPSPNLMSSPCKTSRIAPPNGSHGFEFSDPFASSPPPPTADIREQKASSFQGPKTSNAGVRPVKPPNTRTDLSDPFASSPLSAAQPGEKDTRPPPSHQAQDSEREDAPLRQFCANTFGGSQNWGFPGSHSRLESPPLEQPVEMNARQRTSRSRRRPSIAREASSDPFASSPTGATRSLVQNQIDLTQQDDDDHGPEQRASSNRFVSQGRASKHLSPDPFASSPQPVAHAKRSDFDLISSPPLANKSTSQVRQQQWDPISSSAPETNVINIDSNSDTGNDSEDFPDIDKLARDPIRHPRSQLSRSQSDVLPKAKKTSTVVNARQLGRTADERARDRARRETDREREKERKKEERQRTKEAKIREKERAAALAEVNKMKTDKKVSTPEMIVDIPSSLNDGTKVQLDTLLGGLGVEFTTWDTSDVVVKWRRKVASKWNEDLGYWEPIPKRVMHEKHVAVVMTAQEFVELVLDSDKSIRSHIMSMEEKFAGSQIIYIFEGMTPWMRKNRNLRNRQFTSGVRSEPVGNGRRRAQAQEYISEDLIEDALLELQVMHEVLIHHTTIPLETAQWITILTQHISTIPYKQQKSQAQGAGFCMESGQVKTGEDNKDTYVRMLQEIARVTQPIAYGVSIEFPSVTQLVNGLDIGGPMRLSDVRKTVNREGTLGDKAIGQAVSKRIHKVFTGRDEASTDV